MFIPPNPHQGAYDRFKSIVRRYYRWAYQECKSLSSKSDELSAQEMLIQKRSLVFLDLDLHSLRIKDWKTYSKKIVSECLPPLTADIFKEEREVPGRLSSLNNRIIRHNRQRRFDFEENLRKFFHASALVFEKKLRILIFRKGGDEKKQILYRYLRACELFHLDLFDKLYIFLVHHCTNPPLESALTVKMLRTLCDTDGKKLSATSGILEASLETLLRHAAEMRFDFWGMWSGSGYLAHRFDFVAASLEIGLYLEKVMILLKFGFPYVSDDEAFSLRCSNLLSITMKGRRSILRTVQPLIEKARGCNNTRMMLITDTFAIFCKLHGKKVFERSLRILAFLNRSLSEPYVTPSELYSTMKPVMKPRFMPILEEMVKNYSKVAIFEDEFETYSPRRLMHLCRVVIRKRLASNFKLLDGIEDLTISKTLKSYLRLERN